MKLISLLLFGSGLLIIWFYFSFPKTLQGMQACLDESMTETQTNLAWLQTNSPDKIEMCGRAQAQYTALNDCYRRIFQRYFLPTELVETVMVRRHPNFPRMSRNQAFLKRACLSNK